MSGQRPERYWFRGADQDLEMAGREALELAEQIAAAIA